MKYAVISDIHANLEAFVSVLAEIDRTAVGEIVCLGDIVGYGADPNACVEIVRERGIASIMGNHDAAACGVYEPFHFNPAAREAVLWTRKELSDENRDFLRNLPESEIIDNFLIVHGAISDPDKYIMSAYDAEPELTLLRSRDVCFFGHTHVGVCYALENKNVREITGSEIELENGVKYLINPGSVGQPRDGDPRASFLIYDNEGRAEYRRPGYDVEKAQEKIINKGLNRILAERLSYGL